MTDRMQFGLAISGFSILLFFIVIAILWGRWISKRQKEVEEAWKEFQEHRKELYDRLADPEQIELDFEKSARMREMRDAQRSTLPREGAGPPAKVYRPKFRGAKPGNWRINRP